jgi:DNA-binding response OmpR family regulator
MQPELKDNQEDRPYVLIVEDDIMLGRLLREVFGLAGSRCCVIRSKTSAEQFLRQIRPDLAVIDYQLIGGIGLKAARIATIMRVPVIVTSGHLHLSGRVKKAGYFYLRKHFTPSEVLGLASLALGFDLNWPGNPPIQLH